MLSVHSFKTLWAKFSISHALRLLWIVVICWYELGTFYHHISQCKWPDGSGLDTLDPISLSDSTHVFLVADPQVLDHRSYPERSAWLVTISQVMVDLNLRKSWWAMRQLVPDVTFFLGDMMDGGRFAMPDDEYESYYKRFKGIFHMEEAHPVHYIPGNHDTGLGTSSGFSHKANDRYISHFGPLNQKVEVAGHTFVLIDAPGFVFDDEKRKNTGASYSHWAAAMPGGPIEFLQYHLPNNPTILLSHIPLARPDKADCGPLRERGTIRQGFGYGYQNTLSAEASEFALQHTRPTVIFSGDDHDYCEYLHTYAESDTPTARHHAVKEVTVKSLSMAMGVRKPGFQLLSLFPSAITADESQQTWEDALCLLPDQLGIYLSVYAPLIPISLLVLLVSNALRVSHVYSPSIRSHNLSPDPTGGLIGRRGSGRARGSSYSLRKLDLDGTLSDEDYALPSPGIAVTAKRRPYTYRASQRLTEALWSFLGFPAGTRGGGRRMREGMLRGFVHDVLFVAWTPVVLFVLIGWWMFL